MLLFLLYCVYHCRNCCCLAHSGRLHVPLAEYKQNLAAMVQMAKQAGVQHIMLATPPPVVPEVWAAEVSII